MSKLEKILCILLLIELSWVFYPMHEIDRELMSFNSFYLAELNKHCDRSQWSFPPHTKIILDRISDEQVGVCHKSWSRFEVVVNIKYWYQATFEDQFSTAVHEMHHCYTGAKHTDDPTNFMFKAENVLPPPVEYFRFEKNSRPFF